MASRESRRHAADTPTFSGRVTGTRSGRRRRLHRQIPGRQVGVPTCLVGSPPAVGASAPDGGQLVVGGAERATGVEGVVAPAPELRGTSPLTALRRGDGDPGIANLVGQLSLRQARPVAEPRQQVTQRLRQWRQVVGRLVHRVTSIGPVFRTVGPGRRCVAAA